MPCKKNHDSNANVSLRQPTTSYRIVGLHDQGDGTILVMAVDLVTGLEIAFSPPSAGLESLRLGDIISVSYGAKGKHIKPLGCLLEQEEQAGPSRMGFG